MRLLRWSVLGVAAFAFVYSLVFPLRDYILMYQLITGAIYLSGFCAAIIGGLYWKRGTTASAWGALITGASLAILGGIARAVWPSIPALAEISPQFPLNGLDGIDILPLRYRCIHHAQPHDLRAAVRYG